MKFHKLHTHSSTLHRYDLYHHETGIYFMNKKVSIRVWAVWTRLCAGVFLIVLQSSVNKTPLKQRMSLYFYLENKSTASIKLCGMHILHNVLRAREICLLFVVTFKLVWNNTWVNMLFFLRQVKECVCCWTVIGGYVHFLHFDTSWSKI